jgi:hypothetical protein
MLGRSRNDCRPSRRQPSASSHLTRATISINFGSTLSSVFLINSTRSCWSFGAATNADADPKINRAVALGAYLIIQAGNKSRPHFLMSPGQAERADLRSKPYSKPLFQNRRPEIVRQQMTVAFRRCGSDCWCIQLSKSKAPFRSPLAPSREPGPMIATFTTVSETAIGPV